jgi:hypothetical protein
MEDKAGSRQKPPPALKAGGDKSKEEVKENSSIIELLHS